MAEILSYSLRSTFATEFYQSLTDPNSNDRYYLYYGHPMSWGSTVPSIQDTIKEQNDAKRTTLFYQLITPSDVSLVAPRYDWTSGIVYDQYEDDIALWSESKKYYVLVNNADEYNVYVCLSNNNGAPSTSVPFGTNSEEVITEDGYVWKYLYSLTNEMETFLTNDYMPVLLLDQISYTDERALALNVKANAVNGSIQKITVDSENVVFDNIINPSLTAQYFVQEIIDTEGLTFTVALNNLNPNSNFYNKKYVVYFKNGQIGTIDTYTVSGNIATITLCELVGDPITQSDVYSILPKVNITGSGTGAVAVPRFTNNILTSVEIINGGQNYGFAQAFFLITTTATLSAIIPPQGGHGYDLLSEIKPTNIMINKEINFNFTDDEKFFGAGSRFGQYGIIKNLKTIQGEDASTSVVEYDMVLITQSADINLQSGALFKNVDLASIEFTGLGTGQITDYEKTYPFDTYTIINLLNFNNDTGRGLSIPTGTPEQIAQALQEFPYLNTEIESPYKEFFKVGDIIANRDLKYTGYGEFIGKIIDVEVLNGGVTDADTNLPVEYAGSGGTRLKVQMIRGNSYSANKKIYKYGDDSNLTGPFFNVSGSDYNQQVFVNLNNNFTNYVFYNFWSFKNSTGQGFNQNLPAGSGGPFFIENDIVIQKNENEEETYRARVLKIIEPGMVASINTSGFSVPTNYNTGSATDNRRNCTVVLENISGAPNIPALADWFSTDERIKKKNCFYNITQNNRLLLLTSSERNLGDGLGNTINTKASAINNTSLSELQNSTHILGNESLSIAEIKPNSVAINPNNNRQLNLKILNPSDDFILATISNNSVIEGETVTFLKRTLSGYTFGPSFVSYPLNSMFVLNENYNKVSTVAQVFNFSNIRKIQIKRIGSTTLDSTVIPVPLSGSYLYRESTETTDSAAGFIVSIGVSITSGSDSLIDVYYLEEKGSFSQGDTIKIVENPFVKNINQIGLGANQTVNLTCNTGPFGYINIFTNKYSGEVLYTQNIEPITLATDTNFTTRILLGF